MMRQLLWWTISLAAAGTILLGIASGQDAACIARGQNIECRINQPVVNRAITDYTKVPFAPGDIVTVEAGGCVQTGGSGKTWKRYVDPQGPNTDRFYHGLIYIPGMRGLQRIFSVLNRTIVVPNVIAPGIKTFLQLGYEDDNFNDNGYWSKDDGTGDQCKNQPAAYVIVRIKRAAR